MVIGLSKDTVKVKLGSEKECIQPVTVEIPSSKVKEHIDLAFDSVKNQAKVPGFRPGKAPLDIIKQNFQDTAFARAQDSLIRTGVSEAIKQKNIKAIQSPMISNVKFHPEKAFQMEFHVEVAPTFKISNYKGIKISQSNKKVSDEDVQNKIKSFAEAHSQLVESKAEAVADNHHAVINYEGFLDGKSIEGSKTENFLIDLSAPQAIVGLAEGIIGSKNGEEKEIEVTFPTDSPAKDLAGKKATFKVKIVAIKEKRVPNLNDEFAKDLGVENIETLRSRIRESMEKEAEQEKRRELEKQIIDKLISDNKFAVPKTFLEKQVQALTNRQRYRLLEQGVKKEDMENVIENMKAEIAKQAEREVRLAYLLNEIADTEKIEVDEQEIEKRIQDILSQTSEKNRKKMEKTVRGSYKDQLQSEMKDTKIFDFLINNAKIKMI